MIERVTRAAGVAPGDLDGVAVATGPGGFTGIRVGLAAAHGIALAVKVPLLGVTAFEAVAARIATGSHGTGEVLLVALDSRRAELFVQLFADDPIVAIAPPAAVLPVNLADYVSAHVGNVAVAVAGDAADAANLALMDRPDARSIADSAPHAWGVLLAVRGSDELHGSTSTARPFYLRVPDVTMPKRRSPGVTNTA